MKFASIYGIILVENSNANRALIANFLLTYKIMKTKSKIQPKFNWLLFGLLSALVDDHMRKQIEYLKVENRVLRTQLHKATGRKRIFLTDDQRRILAVKAKAIGAKALGEITGLFAPETILGWYRKLVAAKYDGTANRKGGRKKINQEVIDQVLKFAKENNSWGYQRIQSVMVHLGYQISRTAVYRIIKDAGVNPDPEDKKKTNWPQFIKTHMHVMVATDFFHVEVLTKRGLVCCSILFFIELNSRRVHMAPSKVNPTSEWVDQQIKNYANFDQGLFDNRTYLIHDRDPLFMAEKVQETLETSGVKGIKTAPFSPNQNSFAESFVAGCRKEMFDKVIFTSKEQLDYAIKSYEEYHNHWKPHQGLDGKLIDPLPQDEDGDIVCKEFMGGLLKGYRRVKKSSDIAA